MKQNRRAEDYMKVIYRLREKGSVRGVDIAREFCVSKPTVSVALRKMEDSGLIKVHMSRCIELTKEGERLAREVTERYEVIYGLLTDLGIDGQTAHEDACKMEHGISDASLSALKELRRNLQKAQPERDTQTVKEDFYNVELA